MKDDEFRPRNIFVLVRLVALVVVIPLLVFFWVHLIGGYSFELGVALAIICFVIFGFVFWKFLLPKV